MKLEQFVRRSYGESNGQERDELFCKPGEESNPVSIIASVSSTGKHFTISEEAKNAKECYRFIWHDGKCVGRIELMQLDEKSQPSVNGPFSRIPPRIAHQQIFRILHCFIVLGLRRQGFMIAAYKAIIRELSSKGQVLASRPFCRNKYSRGLWKYLATDPLIKVVRRNTDAGMLDYALILKDDLGIALGIPSQ